MCLSVGRIVAVIRTRRDGFDRRLAAEFDAKALGLTVQYRGEIGVSRLRDLGLALGRAPWQPQPSQQLPVMRSPWLSLAPGTARMAK